MSQVNADTIRKSDGSLGTDIRIKNTSVYESDGGTSVTQNLVQGLCKIWCNFDGTGTIATRDSFNVSGLTDNSTGDYTVSINNNMANASYSYVIGKRGNRPADGDGNVASTTSSQFEHNTRNGNLGSNKEDADRNYSALFGDLA